jgi:murein L,D-transpeptidase YafK
MDASRSTVFVFANTDTGPRYVADFYMTVGKNGTAKVREGDKKTPLGVYRVTGKMPSDRLTDFYGAGAFPLDYPNEWDQMHGRNGHGIWLHGTPFDTYSRPPRASDGCIVLANDDLKALEQYLQLGTTPVVITESIEWAPAEDVARMRTELRQQLERWRGDWESRDTELYLTHYSRRFSANYASSNLSNRMRKRQYWIKEDGRWRILFEGAA